MKYIDSDAVARILTDPQYPYVPKIERAILDIPAADVAPVVHGRWIDDKGNLVPWDEMNNNCPRYSAFCSVCGEWLTASDEYPTIGNFCPNCGAKMNEVDE